MRAAQISELSGPDAVKVVDVDAPAIGEGQLLIDVHAAGVNFPDLLIVQNKYQFKPPRSPCSTVLPNALLCQRITPCEFRTL